MLRTQDDITLIVPKISFVLLQFVLGGVHTFFDAVAQGPHDGQVDLAFAHTIFDTRVYTRVVVHLDYNRVAVPFLQVDAVEPVADKATNTERRLYDSVGNHLNGNAFALAREGFTLLVVAFPVVNLPVAFRHVVLAGVKRLAV